MSNAAKVNAVNSSNNNNLQTAADPEPSPAAATPEQLVEQIRAIRSSIANLTSLTSAERERLRRATTRLSNDAVQAQINIIGGDIETVLGTNAAEVRGMVDEDNRWSAVEDEVKSLFDGIQGANLLRRHAIVIVASQAGAIGASLARSPKNVALASQVKEIRRIKRAETRKKPSSQQTPSADPHTTAAGM
jgi:hypothetical protein